MKTLEQLRTDSEILLEQNALSDNNKLLALVRSGLFDSNKLTLLKRALAKDNDKMTRVERNALLDLLDRLITVVTTDKSVYNKVRQDVMTEDSKVDIDINQIPPILILKRRAIRVFPDGQKVALYWADRINKYISVPYQSTGISEAVHFPNLDSISDPKLKRKATAALGDSEEEEKEDTPSPKQEPIEMKKWYGMARNHGVGPITSAAISGIAALKTMRANAKMRNVKESFLEKVNKTNIVFEGTGISIKPQGGVGRGKAPPKTTTSKPSAPKEPAEKPPADKPESNDKSKSQPQPQQVYSSGTSDIEDNPFQYKAQKPEKGITSKIKGNNPTRPDNTIDPYEDPDSSLHQQQQNIQRRANRNFASGGGNGRTVYESIKSISEGNENGEIQIGESTVLVTPAMAKNIVKLYENVNKVNKAIIRQKLCESEQEFFKILEFAVRKV